MFMASYENVVKNLNGTLGFKWAEFITASKHLLKMDKNLARWAPCYNRKLFMADMTTTGRGESMNSLMKGYMDATVSLTKFLKAFESALDQRKNDKKFAKFREENKSIALLTASP